MLSIVVATDLTPEVDRVLRAAACVAQRAGDSLHVVHAMGLVGMTLGEAMGPLQDGTIRRARDGLEAQIRRAVPPGVPLSHAVDFHDLPRAVETHARALDADLVVVGASAMTPELADRARVPVLVIGTGMGEDDRAE